jgi:hypothetical protein
MELIGPPSVVADRTAAVIRQWRPDASLFLVNVLREDGTTDARDLVRHVRALRKRSPTTPIIVLLDERSSAAIRSARLSGAAGFLGAATAENPEAIAWRVSQSLHVYAVNSRALGRGAPEPQASLTDHERTSPVAVEDGTLVGAELRDPESGRLDATRMAQWLGVPVRRLAGVAGVSQQALSARPDSKRAQAGLAAVARVMATLDAVRPPQQQRIWLRAPNPRLNGSPPIDLLLNGSAKEVEAALRS